MSLCLLTGGLRKVMPLFICGWTGAAAGETLQLVTTADTTMISATGNGDSGTAIISGNGRYVLFASTANNLVAPTNAAPVSGLLPPVQNVYRFDRTNGITELVSASFAGTGGGNDDSVPMGISTNGRYALFESFATNLVAQDTNRGSGVFVRDVVNSTTVRLPVPGRPAFRPIASHSSVMTPDGRYVAFIATTNGTGAGVLGVPALFVCDLWSNPPIATGVAVVSSNASGLSGTAPGVAITPDGQYVAFFSNVTNTAPGGTTNGDIYISDLVGGTTVCASAGGREMAQLVLGISNVVSFNPIFSDDGKYVAFETCSNTWSPSLGRGMVFRYNRVTGFTDLVDANASVPATAYGEAGTLEMTPDGRYIAFLANVNGILPTNSAVYLWDGQDQLSTLVSPDPTNGTAPAGVCWSPVMDPTGRYVAFVSSAVLTTNRMAGDCHLYRRDTLLGITSLVDINTNGVGVGVDPNLAAALAPDGQSIAFTCADSGMVPADWNRSADVFVRDFTRNQTQLVSARHPLLPSLAPDTFSLLSSAVSSDGRFVGFASDADNLVPNDTNNYRDVFVRDVIGGSNLLVSVAVNGAPGSGFSTEPSISAEGRYVAFSSCATNLTAGDTNKAQDVFVRDLQTGTTALVSRSYTGGGGSGDSYAPVISTDGNWVMYRSKAQNLSAGTYTTGSENLFLRNLTQGSNYALTYGGAGAASMTPDGHYVAFVGAVTAGGTSFLYLWNAQTAARVYTNLSSSISSVIIGAGAQQLVYVKGSGTSWTLNATYLPAGTNQIIPSNSFAFYSVNGMRLSQDERYLAYAGSTTLLGNQYNWMNDIYVYDLQTGSNVLVNRIFTSSNVPSGFSDSPTISPDGRFVAFRSAASNCVPGDLNEAPDVFVFDRVSGATTLVSGSRLGNWTANRRSSQPLFTGDSRSLVFTSWASDLLEWDYNLGGGVYALSLYPSNSTVSVRVSIDRPATSKTGPTLTWPMVSGKTCKVQYKNDLGDVWKDLNGQVIYTGLQGYIVDLTPVTSQRFYRIVVSQ